MANGFGSGVVLVRTFSAARGYDARGKLQPDINGDSEVRCLAKTNDPISRVGDKLGPWGKKGQWGKRVRETSGALSGVLLRCHP
ncbi:hypothetical protein N7523_003230 [Penicillium sp. IBT 18751x]|nr:hypothetical protein N7523_003230 [Penicillium sp. IBT 18751x]